MRASGLLGTQLPVYPQRRLGTSLLANGYTSIVAVVLIAGWVLVAFWCVLFVAVRRRTPPASVRPRRPRAYPAALTALWWVLLGVVASIEATWFWTGLFGVSVVSPMILLCNTFLDRRAGIR